MIIILFLILFFWAQACIFFIWVPNEGAGDTEQVILTLFGQTDYPTLFIFALLLPRYKIIMHAILFRKQIDLPKLYQGSDFRFTSDSGLSCRVTSSPTYDRSSRSIQILSYENYNVLAIKIKISRKLRLKFRYLIFNFFSLFHSVFKTRSF